MLTVRKYILLLPIITLLLGPIVWELPFSNPLLVDPVIVVAGSTDQGSFGNDVFQAVRRAALRLPEGSFKPDVEVVSSPESPPFDPKAVESFRRRLMRAMTEDNIVAIISANVTDMAEPCIEIGARLRIPVFLTVATNDRLLASNNGTCFRLVPSDSMQAAVVARWAKEQIRKDPGKPIAVFYDQTSYATDLVRTLRRENFVGAYALLPFQLGTTTETVGLLRYAKDAGVSTWIFVGYPEQGLDFLSKKRNLKIPGDVLFTDGCYGNWLKQIPSDGENVFLSFPKKRRVSGSLSDRSAVRGFGDYGYDAYSMIAKSLPQIAGRRSKKQTFISTFRLAINDQRFDIQDLRQEYQFDAHGENVANDFDIYAVSKGEIP